MPRPDGKPDFLGLTCTDEPALKQSDPALLALRLRHKLKANPSSAAAGSCAEQEQPLGWVQDPAQQAGKVDGWIDACSVLHQVRCGRWISKLPAASYFRQAPSCVCRACLQCQSSPTAWHTNGGN